MTAPPAGQPSDLMHLLTQAERLLGRRLTTILHAEGYSLDAWRVIGLLADGEGHHMAEIAEHAFLPPGTLTKLVGRLVEDNLVYRRVDPLDRRRIRAYLITRGRSLHQRISQQVDDNVAQLSTSDAEHDLLTGLLTNLINELEPHREAVEAS